MLLKKITAFIWLTAFLCVTTHSVKAQESAIKELSQPVKLSEFKLIDHTGQAFGRDQFERQWSLVFLGFTSCPDICPLTMSKLEGVRAELGLLFPPHKIPRIVFLAVDPARDKPILGEYLKYFHPENIGITGETAEIDALVKSLDGFYRFDKKPGGVKPYDVVHTSSVLVINPNAEMVGKISPPFGVSATARDLAMLIRKGQRNE